MEAHNFYKQRQIKQNSNQTILSQISTTLRHEFQQLTPLNPRNQSTSCRLTAPQSVLCNVQSGCRASTPKLHSSKTNMNYQYITVLIQIMLTLQYFFKDYFYASRYIFQHYIYQFTQLVGNPRLLCSLVQF